MLVELERAELLVRGELRPGGTEREWCDPDVLRRLRRASLAALRREVEPVDQEALARFLPAWHGIDRRASLREALVPLQALPLPVALWESRGAAAPRARLPARAPRRALTASGEVVWVGAGPRSRRAVLPRGRRRARPGAGARRARKAPSTTRSAPRSRGALFWDELLAETGLDGGGRAARALGSRLGRRGDERRVDAAARGAPLRRAEAGAPAAPLLAPPRRRRRPRRPGRWSRTERLFAGAPDRRALAELLLERQGIVTRDGVRAEGIPGGYGAVYAELRALETLGLCRRGYFVEGLGGAQFALGGAVERLRELRDRRRGRATRSCSPRPIRRSRTAPRCRGRSARVRVRRASPARTSSRSAASRCSTSSAAAARSCRCATRTRPGCGPRSPRSSRTCERGGAQAPRGRALRRRAGRRDRRDAAARRGRLPRRPAARRPASLASPRPNAGLQRAELRGPGERRRDAIRLARHRRAPARTAGRPARPAEPRASRRRRRARRRPRRRGSGCRSRRCRRA